MKKLYVGSRIKNFVARNMFHAGRELTDEESILFHKGEIPESWYETPAYFDMGKGKKPISSGMGYVQSPYSQWYTKVYGVVPLADYSNYRTMYRTVPIIKAAVDTTVNMACGKGFKIECEDSDVKDYLDSFFEQINAPEIAHVIAHDCLVYGNAFIELCYERNSVVEVEDPTEKDFAGKPVRYKHVSSEGKVVWLKALDPYYMRVRRDAFDNIFGFIQWISYPPVAFTSEKIAHFKWLPKSWSYESAYGCSTLMSLIKTQDYIWQLERDFQAIVHTYAKPILSIYGGTADKPYSETGMKNLKTSLAADGVSGKYFVRGDVRVEAISTPANLTGISTYFNYLTSQRLSILGVPPVLLGMPEGTNRATSEVTFSDFLTRVQMLQSIIADVFEDQILPKILKDEFGEDYESAHIVFNEVFEKDLLGESTRLQGEFKAGIISKNEARISLGYEPTENEEDNIPTAQLPSPAFPFSAQIDDVKKKDNNIMGLNKKTSGSSETSRSPAPSPKKDDEAHELSVNIETYMKENELKKLAQTKSKDAVMGLSDINHECHGSCQGVSVPAAPSLISKKEKVRKHIGFKPDDKELIKLETELYNHVQKILNRSQEDVLLRLKKQMNTSSHKGNKFMAQDEPYFDYMLFSDDDLAEIEKFVREHVKVTFTMGRSRAETDLGKEISFDDKDYIDTLSKNSIGYFSNMGDEMQDRLRETIAEGIKDNLTYQELSVKIRDDFGLADERARLISITETERVHTNSYICSAKEFGVETLIWQCSDDDLVCPVCLSLHNEEIPVDEAWDCIPNRSHPRCRCFTISKIKE